MQPVRCQFSVATGSGQRVVIVCHFARLQDELGRIRIQPIAFLIAGGARLRQLRQGLTDFRNPLRREFKRQQVRVGEIAIVVGLFLAAHGACFHAVGVKKAGFLLNRAAAFHDVALPLNFEVDGLFDKAEGVDVFQLNPRIQQITALLADRNVGIATEGAFLHIAVAYAKITHQMV